MNYSLRSDHFDLQIITQFTHQKKNIPFFLDHFRKYCDKLKS